ncbi:MAG: hypothetical protein F6K17_35855 [Okeania sp. SIO3C4]|nr:hypothetical protein [Okeania sp. SIO3C4]
MKNHGILLLLFLFFCSSVYAQEQTETAIFFKETRKYNNRGMLVLGSWAVANIGLGINGMRNTSGSDYHFHQMNFAWNFVNLSLASYGLISDRFKDYSNYNDQELMKAHKKIERVFLINSFLDVVYISVGYGMTRLEETPWGDIDVFKGFGNALILQGGFLLLFDIAMYGLQHSRRKKFINSMPIKFSFGVNSVGIRMNF